MRHLSPILLFATSFLLAREDVPVGSVAPALVFHDLRFESVELDDFEDADILVILFLDTRCPAALEGLAPAANLARDLAGRGLRVLGIDSNTRTSALDVSEMSLERELPFEVYKDHDQSVARALGAQRTPEAVVLDRERRIRYRGAITSEGQAVLRRASEQVLDGSPVKDAELPSAGCLIRKPRPVRGRGITWGRHARSILETRCVGCHRAGAAGSFSLATYDDAQQRAKAIRQVVATGRMPPVFADAVTRKSAHVPEPLSQKERALLLGWLAGGAVEGEAKTQPKTSRLPQWSLARLEAGPGQRVLELKAVFELKTASSEEGEANVVRGRSEITAGERILAIRPSLPVDADGVRVRLVTGEGAVRALLTIPLFASDWPLVYRFAEPILVDKGSHLELQASVRGKLSRDACVMLATLLVE